MSNPTNYYTVIDGTNSKIYISWLECKKHITKRSIYKKFNTFKEAKQYLLIKDRIVSDSYDFSECINIYTDGSCVNNGSTNSKASIGIHFGNNYKKDYSQILQYDGINKLTNNRAELKAILTALSLVLTEIQNGIEIMIHTDSLYSITALTSLYCDDPTKPNIDFIKIGNKLFHDYSNIKFHHIYSHTNNTDVHSKGNECADKLANINNETKHYDDKNLDLGNIKLVFGKYKDMSLDDVYIKQPGYLTWCIENNTKQKKLMIAYLETKK